MKALKLAVLFLVAFATPALAQTAPTITFTAQTITGDGSVVPVLTWSTNPAATSCTASGDWTGTKGAAGSETLPATQFSRTYNLACAWPADAQATLTWVAPTVNVNGTPYTDPKGFKVYFGPTSTTMTQTKTITSPSTVSTVITPLAIGSWSFAVTAINSRDVESAQSNVASKTIAAGAASGSVGITVNPKPANPTGLVVQ